MDLVSKLPDEILISILSLLSMEEAGRTRVLCRRWEKLWMNTFRFTPSLDLYFRNGFGRKTTSTIVNWVNQVVKLHDEGQTVEDLTVQAYNLNSSHSDSIDGWIEFAAQKRVKKLYLDFNNPIVWLPEGLPYSFQSSFPIMHWLRDLHTRRIQVSEEVIHRLFSTSPFLERLSLIDSPYLDKLEIDSSSAPNLKFLLLKCCKNLQHLRISTPILNSMRIGRFPLLRHFLLSVPNLSNATLSLREGSKLIEYYLHLLGQLKTLSLILKGRVST